MLKKISWQNIAFLVVVFLSLFLSIDTSIAATREEILIKIAEIYGQINYFQEELGRLQQRFEPYNGISSGFLFKQNLRFGDQSEEIKYLQIILNEEKIPYVKCVINGQFDLLTKQAVIGFQEKYSSEILTPIGVTQGTGFVGEMTRKKLNNLLLNSPTSCVALFPSPPILVLPPEGSVQDLTPDFVWFPPKDWGADCSIETKEYSLRLDDDSDFSSPLWTPGFSGSINHTRLGLFAGDPVLEYATTYYWRLRAQNGGLYSDWAIGSFRTPPLPSPFIKLKSPNGGEQWQIGQTYSIGWELSSSHEVTLKLYPAKSDGTINLFVQNIPIRAVASVNNKLNSYSWTIPNVAPGDYFIVVDYSCCHEGELGVEFDYNDLPFTIIEASTTQE